MSNAPAPAVPPPIPEPGSTMVVRADGTAVQNERVRPDPLKKEGGTALHAAVETGTAVGVAAVNVAADNWKKWREMTAFALICMLLWSMYRDFVQQSRADNISLRTAIAEQTAAINNTILAVNAKNDNYIAKMDVQIMAIKDDHARVQRAIDKLTTVLERIERQGDRRLPGAVDECPN